MRDPRVHDQATSAASAEMAIQRLVLVVTPPWTLSMVAAALSELPGWSPVTVVACGLGVGIGYLGYLLSPSRHPAIMLAPMVATSLVIGMTGPPGLGLSGYPLMSTWLSLTLFIMGALIPGRAAYLAGTGTATVVLGLSYAVQRADGHPVSVSGMIAVAVYSLADCYVAAAAIGVLRRTAADADASTLGHARAEAAAARARAGQAELRRVSRLIHDTVVNTLGAVARWPQSDRDAVAARCAADLALLRRVDGGRLADPELILASATRRAGLLGLRLDVSVERLGPELDEAVARALEGASWEALNNVAKHSGQATARLAWYWDASTGRMVLSDRGTGFDPASGWSGGSLESVLRRCREAGVSADVATGPGIGTAVELTWTARRVEPDPEPHEDPPDEAGVEELDRILAGTVLAVALVLGGVGAISLAGIPAGWPRWGTAAGLAIVVAVGVQALGVRRGRAHPRPPLLAYPVGAFLVSVLPGIGMGLCDQYGEWSWGALGGLAVVVGAMWLDRRKSVIVATIVAYTLGNLVPILRIPSTQAVCAQNAWAVLVVDIGVITALLAYSRRLSTVWAAGHRQRTLQVAELRSASEAREATAVRRQLLGIARTVAEPVMAGLASGSLDPRDPDVRAWCARAEGTLRALSALPVTEPSGAGQVLAAFVIAAHDRGVRVTLTLSPGAIQPDGLPAGLEHLLHELLAVLDPDASVQVTLLRVEGTTRILALLDRAPVGAADGLRDGGWSVSVLDDQVLAEATPAPAPVAVTGL